MSYSSPAGNQVAIEFENAYTRPSGNQVAIPFASSVPVPIAVPESYTTPFGVTLTAPAPGVLANDTLNGAAAALTSSTSHGVLTFNPDGSFQYVPTPGYTGSDSFSYTLTNTWGTSTAAVSLTVAPLAPTTRYVVAAPRLAFSMPARRARTIAAMAARAPRMHAATRLTWSHADSVGRSLAIPFVRVARTRREASMPWSAAPAVRITVDTPWARVPRLSTSTTAPWSVPQFRGRSASTNWRSPDRHQLAAALAWSLPARMHVSAELPFSRPPSRGRHWWLPWGHARPVQWTVRSPGVVPPPAPPPGSYQPPAGNRVAIAFLCPQLEFAGNEVPVPLSPAACYFAWPKPRIYVVQNSAGVVRLPERTPIAVDTIDLAQGVDDVHWTMGMALADPTHLELLKPDADGPKIVEITINGHVWTAAVETYQQDRHFPTRSVSVSGRSQSALLDAPYAPSRSRVETVDKLAQQLIDDELALTEFTADYSAVAAQAGIGGWMVTGGAFHYDSQSPIAAIRTVAAASGSVVQAHPWDTVLLVRPRYPASPWDWATTAPDKQIQDDIILGDSLRPASKPLYDYVLVSGEQVGFSDPIVRDGAAGDTRAQMVVDPLMTDHLATRERGRNVLCDRGEQADIDITIPLFPASVTDQPGLVLPLQLVQVIEPASWKGLATATKISAAMQSVNGVGVLVVEQTVTLERHYSDAE